MDRANVYLLNLQGNVISVPRYDILGIASYPINHIPISTITLPKSLKKDINYYQIKTKHNKTLVDLVEGWPIGFSKDKISFLNKNGLEIVVSRNSIWSIDILPSVNKRTFSNQVRYQYDFLHPASMMNCPKKLEGNQTETSKKIDIVPQEFISDPITIKRKFDDIQTHHDKVKMYVRSQKFYPVPLVHKNIVTLGFWGATGSRYGSSNNRNNNGSPILIEELSTGPFGYQHIILTGAAPNDLFIHEEPQTQLYYHFKADYFHASIFFDPNSVLIGEKYRWQNNDISNGETRTVENFILETGLDFGHFSLIYVPAASLYLGTKETDTLSNKVIFKSNNIGWSRYGMGYQNHLFKTNIVYGQRTNKFSGTDNYDFNETTQEFEYTRIPGKEYKINFIRLNSQFEILNRYKIANSFIGKRMKYGSLVTNSYTAATYLNY